MRFIAVIAFLMTVVSGATAQREQSGSMGIGVGSCSEFAQHYRENPQFWEGIYFSWAQGFMTGLNVLQVALKRPQRDLNALPVYQQMARLRAFCDERPLAVFGEAAHSLFLALPEIPPQ
jgi:hypothetical protein